LVNCVNDTYTVGGSVSGLTGSGLVLQNNGGDNLAIGADGGFTFATPLDDGSDYAVKILTQPSDPNQTCSISNGSGAINASDETNVSVTCVISYQPTSNSAIPPIYRPP